MGEGEGRKEGCLVNAPMTACRSLPRAAIVSYCPIELPTAENILVELDPMRRTVTTTSRITTANMAAYSATS